MFYKNNLTGQIDFILLDWISDIKKEKYLKKYNIDLI
jgi:hypothetical protein